MGFLLGHSFVRSFIGRKCGGRRGLKESGKGEGRMEKGEDKEYRITVLFDPYPLTPNKRRVSHILLDELR